METEKRRRGRRFFPRAFVEAVLEADAFWILRLASKTVEPAQPEQGEGE